MSATVARIESTTFPNASDLLEAIGDALAVARLVAPEAPVQFHAITEDGRSWELAVMRHPIPLEVS